MSKDKEFQWAVPMFPKQGDPIEGEIATVNLPVQVYFEWSDKIVEDVDEHNNPVSFTSGYIMKVMPQTFVYRGQARVTKVYTTKE